MSHSPRLSFISSSNTQRPDLHSHQLSMPSKRALLCIDMQNDFCLPDALLCVRGAMQCLPNVIKAVEVAREHEVPVIWVVREHHPSGRRGGPPLFKALVTDRSLTAYTTAGVDVDKYREFMFKHGSGANVKGTPGGWPGRRLPSRLSGVGVLASCREAPPCCAPPLRCLLQARSWWRASPRCRGS